MLCRDAYRDWTEHAACLVLDCHEVPTYREWLADIGSPDVPRQHLIGAYLRGVGKGVAFLLENVGHTLGEPDRDADWAVERCKAYMADLQANVLECLTS